MSNSFLSDLLEMDDEEVFRLVDAEYGLSETQKALHEIIEQIMHQLKKLRKREENMVSEITELREENDRLCDIINEKSKYLKQISIFICRNIEL